MTTVKTKSNKNDLISKALLLLCVLILFNCINSVIADHVPDALIERRATEYQIKAVYLYKFLFYVTWPQNKDVSSGTGETKEKLKPSKQQDTIYIGILGKDPFGDSFKGVEGKLIKPFNRKLAIKRFDKYHKDLDLSSCTILFICSSEKSEFEEIAAKLDKTPVLTVADSKNFLKKGGMINLVRQKGKIRWQINRTPIKLAKLKLSSQLLRAAVKTVEIPKLPDQPERPSKPKINPESEINMAPLDRK